MTSTDFHLRHLIGQATEQRSLRLVDDAFAIIEANFDRFGGEFSPELLVLFAEVASDLREREPHVARAVELFERLRCEDDQFKVRALLVRCVCEARLGTETFHLKGLHLLQQLKYALSFLTQALSIAARPGNDTRYGFLVYNASLVFWDIARPLCRMGWQRNIVQEATQMLDALKAVAKPGGGTDAKGKGAAPAGGAAAIPLTMEMSGWLTELALNVSFGLEDAEKNADAQKMVDYAMTLVEEAKDPKLKALVLNAKAYLARKAPGKVKEDIDKASGSTVMGTVHFVRNGGIPKEQAEDQLIAAWKTIDAEYDLRQAKENWDPNKPGGQDGAKPGGRVDLKPQQLVELAQALRAACAVDCWAVAQPMLARLEKCQVPAGRGRLLLDLSKAEVDVWQACNVKKEDPQTKFLLSPAEQRKREIEARHRAVRLVEQCIATAKRLEELDIVEESAVVMWNMGRELACKEHRFRVHKSFQKCAEILEEIQSVSLAQLRVLLHFEVACCEIAHDLLTKGREELHRALAIDYTAQQQELPDSVKQVIAPEADPGPFVRRLDAPIDLQLHLLNWKLNVYAEPTDPADQVMLLLDQVYKQTTSSGKQLAMNLLMQGYGKLDSAIEDVTGDKLQTLEDTFKPPPRVVTSEQGIKPLPRQAPATVQAGGAKADEIAALVPQPIRDQQPKSLKEAGVAQAKRMIALMCRISLEAHRFDEISFSIKVANRALAAAASSEGALAFGPPPIEVEGALLLAEVAYVKAQCLSKQLEEYGVINGMDDEAEEPPPPEGTEAAAAQQTPFLEDLDESDEESRELTPEEKAKVCGMKRELIASLLYGLEKGYEFRQWWMVSNGLRHWWNLHIELVGLSHENPQLLARTLPEYQEGLKTMQRYLHGEAALPRPEFDPRLAANLTLAGIAAGFENGQLAVLETEQLMVIKRLGEHERKDVVTRVSELCKEKEKPLPDLARLRPDRLEPAGAPAPAKGAKGAPAAAPVAGADKSDLQGNEADIVMAIVGIPFAKDSADAMKLVEQAVGLLNVWEPKPNDESMLTLWVELWTRLGRQCINKPMHPNEGAKYALMCGIKGLGKADAPTPKFASRDRLHWRGACHALCGEVFQKLVDPQKQEKQSLTKLRRMSVEQYERCCEYATLTSNLLLASFGANSLWNVALPLMHSADTRQALIGPLTRATRALACVKYSEDPFFFVGLYRALFDCYSDTNQWDKIHEMLNEAFTAVPPTHHRRLWSLRMLALSRQGKNVFVAMGKMKESQAKAQANIWLVLASASSKQADQFNAFLKATEILQTAEQPDVVEVRLQFADWLLRNGFDLADAQEQLNAAADLLLELEDEEEDEEDEEDELYGGDALYRDGIADDASASEDWDQSESDSKSFTGQSRRSSKVGSQMGRSESGRSKRSQSKGKRGGARSVSGRSSRAGSKAGSKAGSRAGSRAGSKLSRMSSKGSRAGGRAASVAGSARSRRSSVASKASKAKKAEEDDELANQLFSRQYEALCRIYATRSRLDSGEELHAALLSASHFAVRFFASTVDLANASAQRLAALAPVVPDLDAAGDAGGEAAAGGGEAAAAGGERRGSAMGSKKTLGGRKEEVAVQLVPSFSAPSHLADWASEELWPWSSGTTLEGLLTRAEQADLLDTATCSYAGHADAFARPPLSFHMLARLEEDLEEQGYHLQVLPVLALHLQLAQTFESEPVRDAIACLARMRLSRMASLCRLHAAAEAAEAKWSAALRALPETFGSFEEEREQVRSQRAGRNAEPLESDWAPAFAGDRARPGARARVGAEWSCAEVRAYEVWTLLSKECVLHGELWMASLLSAEAAKHAKDHGDRRTLRELCLTRARMAFEEGKDFEVINNLKDVTAADAEQAAGIAALLSDAYRRSGHIVQADSVLTEALRALDAAAPKGAEETVPSAVSVLARSIIRSKQVMAEVSRLRAAPVPSHEWLSDLQSVFLSLAEVSAALGDAGLHCRRTRLGIDFATAIAELVEARRQELDRDPANAGVITFAHLTQAMEQLAEALAACKASRDKALGGAVPVEGLDGDIVLPAEVLSARFDTWNARCLALGRELTAAWAKESSRRSSKVPPGGIFSTRPPPPPPPAAADADAAADATAAAGEAGAEAGGDADGDAGGDATAAVAGGDKTTLAAPAVDPAVTLQMTVEAWHDEVDRNVSAEVAEKERAREMDQVETSVGVVANAVTSLQLVASKAGSDSVGIRGPPLSATPAEGSAGEHDQRKASLVGMPMTRIDALVELGRLQFELATSLLPRRKKFEPPISRWDPPASPEPAEQAEGEAGEGGEVAPPAEAAAGEAGGEEAQEAASGPPSLQEAIDAGAKATLAEAALAAVAARRFGAAARALRPLALEAYGVQDPEATFDFLVWLQSVETCIRAEETLAELFPEDHGERVQLRTLRQLEERWPEPERITTYQSTVKRLQLESPLFQRLQLADLPPVGEMLLSNLQPNTLVVTLQVHQHFLYLGAVCTPPPDVEVPAKGGKAPPPDPDAVPRWQKLRHLVLRRPLRESELTACVQKLNAINLAVEKDLITAAGIDETLAGQFEALLAETDACLFQPMVTEMIGHFWKEGLQAEHAENPQRILLLPDNFLWPLPLERLPSFLSLFPAPAHSHFARDFSLHLFVQRMQTLPPFPRPSSSVLLTDAFNEDSLRSGEDPKSETMCALHKRLVTAKVVSLAERSLNGQMITASSEDIKGMLADCTMFMSLGFGRFFTTMSARQLASQDLRHVKLVALFHRSQNDRAFRRQTKSDSAKSVRHQALENSYGAPLLAAFRGVQCNLQVFAPVPISLGMRCFETFAKGLAAAKPVAKALEDALTLKIDDPTKRYARSLEGGTFPGVGAADPKKGAPPPSETTEDLLPLHTRTAYFAIGLAWQPSETAEPAGKKK